MMARRRPAADDEALAEANQDELAGGEHGEVGLDRGPAGI